MSVWLKASEHLDAVDKSQEALQQQFLNIQVPYGSNLAMVSAKKRKNAGLNRYLNILPYDHNGVKIGARSNGSSSRGRYINASHMKNSPNDLVGWSYIAAQGPMPSTIADFWQMVVEQNCTVIIMLTQVLEGNANKCAQYFPLQAGETLQSPSQGGACVTCTSTEEMCGAAIVKRTVEVWLEESDSAFQCTHYLFKSWPDHGAPTETRSIRILMDLANRDIQAMGGLPCIHCSAGVGRTGTYISIDVVLKRLHAMAGSRVDDKAVAASLDLEALIGHLRSQRVAMVQSLEQLRYIYNVLQAYAREAVPI